MFLAKSAAFFDSLCVQDGGGIFMEKKIRFTNSYPMSRRAFMRFAGIAGGTGLLSACVAPVAPQGGQGQEAVAPAAARTTLRLQSSFPVDYPNTLVMSQDVFGEYLESHSNYEVEVNFVPVPDVARSFVQALEVDQAPDLRARAHSPISTTSMT
jgi:hypothetical protein